jgi:hypothetical protein
MRAFLLIGALVLIGCSQHEHHDGYLDEVTHAQHMKLRQAHWELQGSHNALQRQWNRMMRKQALASCSPCDALRSGDEPVCRYDELGTLACECLCDTRHQAPDWEEEDIAGDGTIVIPDFSPGGTEE